MDFKKKRKRLNVNFDNFFSKQRLDYTIICFLFVPNIAKENISHPNPILEKVPK